MAKETKTTVLAIVDELCTAVGALAASDPRAAREAVVVARNRLDAPEGAAIRAALIACDWNVSRAAKKLGYARAQMLFNLFLPGRRQEAIGREVLARFDGSRSTHRATSKRKHG